MQATLFISDLHLSPERPDKLALFRQFLQGPALEVTAVYILGDLFEQFWVGNDDRTPPNPAIVAALRDCTDRGGKLFFMRGNRELMLDRGFEDLTGCRLLPDQTVIDLDGEKVLLMHGDLLCSGDIRYQRYRRFMESTLTKRLFPALPYAVRVRLAHGLRPWMHRSKQQKPAMIVNADQATIEQFMQHHAVSRLIHGHTHRPGRHEFPLDGNPAERIVLGDWYEDDSVLVYRDGEYRLMAASDLVRGEAIMAPR